MSSGRTGAGDDPLAECRQRRDRSRYGRRHGAFPDRPDKIRRRDVAFQRFDRRHEARLDHQQFRRGVAQDVAELDAAQRGVDRHGHGAHPGAAEIDFQKFRPVRAHQRDAVAGLNSGAASGGPRMRRRSQPSRHSSIVFRRRRTACGRDIARPAASEWSREPGPPAGSAQPPATRSARPAAAWPRCYHLPAHASPGVSPGWSAIDRTWPAR